MPIDIASGSVHLELEDVVVPGSVALAWDRRYSTAFDSHTALGRNWTCRYFASLTREPDGFRFLTAEGGVETAADAEGVVDAGGTLRSLGGFYEIFRRSRAYVVQRWNVDTGDVIRYCFAAGAVGFISRLTSIEDVSGQGLDLSWSDDGRLLTVAQRLEGRALRLAYDGAGRIKLVLLRGRSGVEHSVARYEYDADGCLRTAEDALGHSDRYEYNASAHLVREVLKDGGVFSYRYDNRARCVKTTGLDRYQEKRLRFIDASRHTEVIDSYERVSIYNYLPSGQITSEIDPLGGTTVTDYDNFGRIIARRSATGETTRFGYDAQGNRSTHVDAAGGMYSYVYNENHLPVAMTDPLGGVWRRRYDDGGRLVATQDAAGSVWGIEYDAAGAISEVVDPLGARRTFRYVDGVLAASSDWRSNETRLTLDDFGRVVSREDPLGARTRFAFDAVGNLIDVVLADGARLQASYDAAGNLTSFTDGLGRTTSFRYGSCQRLLQRMDPAGGTLNYAWGSEPGRLERITNELGEVYEFERDGAGRVVRERGFDGAQRHFAYDADGYCIKFTNANEQTIQLLRDPMHRVVAQVLPDGSTVSFKFDLLGNLVRATNSDCEVMFERDAAGRVTCETRGEHWVRSAYDVAGRLIGTETSFGHAVNYEADANGWLRRLTTKEGRRLEIARNGRGYEVSRQLPGGVVLEHRYDPVGRVVEQRAAHGWPGGDLDQSPGAATVAPIMHRSFNYDLGGSVTGVADARWGRVGYSYDPAERLLEAAGAKQSERFTYDAAGNLASSAGGNRRASNRTFESSSGNRLTRAGNIAFTYDREGRRITKTELGEGGEQRTWRYDWDALGRLRSMTTPEGGVWAYKYDPFARRIEKAGGGDTKEFVWDRGALVHERDARDRIATCIYRPNSIAPLAFVQDALFYSVISDHLGTPRELVDAHGDVAWAINYSAWGESVESRQTRPSDDGCPIRFLGQWYDKESQLNYNRFRYYDPEIGSFISQDPLGLAGGINLYSYAKNPIRFIDPLGLCGSPDVDPRDVAGKTPAEIEAHALSKGLIPKGPDPKGGRGAYVDPVTGEQRVLIHPSDPTSGPHAHVNDPSGQRLDIGGNVVPPESTAAHLPIKTT